MCQGSKRPSLRSFPTDPEDVNSYFFENDSVSFDQLDFRVDLVNVPL